MFTNVGFLGHLGLKQNVGYISGTFRDSNEG
jgi:hypothetical protein